MFFLYALLAAFTLASIIVSVLFHFLYKNGEPEN